MNLGIRQTSRKHSKHTKLSQGLYVGGKTLDDIANTFGLDVSSLGEEAENIWTKLNDLHTSDPAAYDAYIQEQIKEMNNTDGQKTILPEKGFVVKAFMTEKRNNQNSKKLFINFCHHRAIEIPVDSNGEKVSDQTDNLDNAQIPMIISSLRDFRDNSGKLSHTIDVILNPWCLKRSSVNTIFKSQVICLSIKSIMEERKITINPKWKLIRSMYKGGIGKEKTDVNPFHLDLKAIKQKNSIQDDSSKDLKDFDTIMNDPQSLLQSLRNEDNETQSDLFSLENHEKKSNSKSILIEEVETKKDKKVTLIEEIDTNVTSNEEQNCTLCQVMKQKKTPLSTQMKGFLNQKEKYKVLYPKPSTGDGSKGTGGTYSKFMSKCQVVDTADLAPTLSTKKNEDKSFGSDMKKGFLKKSNDGHFWQQKSERGDFDHEFSNIMKKADPQFARTFNEASEASASVEELEEAIQGLADGMENQQINTCSRKMRDLHVPIEPEHLEDTNKENKQHSIPYTAESDAGELTLILDLIGSNVSKIGDIVVEVCDGELDVSTLCGWHLKYFNKYVHDGVKAKFKKKTKKLVLTFSSKN